jgi:multiple sugar transport system substrate-binding protein
MKFHALLIGILVLGAAKSLPARGSQEDAGTVTIHFMTPEVELDAASVQRFQAANPDIQLVRLEEDTTRLVAELAAGSPPDLIRNGMGIDVAYFARRGLLYDLSDFFSRSKIIRLEDIDLLGNACYRYDGKQFGQGSWYGLCKDYNNIGCITYNREHFRNVGLPDLSETEPIRYYDELYQLARKLTRKDAAGRTLAWGLDFPDLWVPFLVSDMATAEGWSLFADPERSRMNEDPRVRGLWKYWLRFPLEDISSNIRNLAPDWPAVTFASGRVAMVQLGYWYGAQLMNKPGYEKRYGWAPTPVLRAGSPPCTNNLGATGVFIAARTRFPRQAFRVFEWYMGGEIAVERARTGWGIPPLLSLRRYLPEDNAYNASRKRIAFEDARYMVPVQSSPYTWGGLCYTDWNNSLRSLVEGVIDADGFLDRWFKELNEFMKQGKEELGG